MHQPSVSDEKTRILCGLCDSNSSTAQRQGMASSALLRSLFADCNVVPRVGAPSPSPSSDDSPHAELGLRWPPR